MKEGTTMAYSDANDLIRFLGESAQDLTMKAVLAAPEVAKELTEEAEELMALRSKLLQRIWDDELNAQMPLPLGMKEAA
jgi:2-polyprenyl-6-methoxyphenol hydroxylase-like FAD-dependent oxidoreductase